MATATKLITPFTGEDPTQEISTWLRDTDLILKMTRLNADEKARVLILSLRATALTWIADVIDKTRMPSYDDLMQALQTRFVSRASTKKLVKNFFTNEKMVRTAKELGEILKDACFLYQRENVPINLLLDAIGPRLPAEMKMVANQTAREGGNWIEITRAIESMIPISFQEQVDEAPSVMAITPQRRPQNREEKYCQLHGKTNHTTKECFTIKRVEEAGWKRKINFIEEPNESINKFERYSVSKNPFITKIKINNKTTTSALIDTGADANILEKKLVPEDIKIWPSKNKLKSACGGDIKIVGEAREIPIEVHGKTHKIEATIVSERPSIPILGAEFIVNHPEIIEEILKKETNKDNNTMAIEAIKNQKDIKEIENEYKDLFKEEINEESICLLGQHSIDTGASHPIKQVSRRVPIFWEETIDEMIKKQLEQGIIQNSKSEWCSRIVVVPKKDGTPRMCVDYRAVNYVTIKDRYPIPRIDTILDKLSKATIFSTFDATSGYHQIAMNPSDAHKTAFAWKGGLYEYRRMPFGLCNGPATFQRIMDQIFRNEQNVIPYFDDIIVFSNTMSEHVDHLERTFSKLKAAGICLNKKKSQIAKSEVRILGFDISKGTVKPDEKRTLAIKEATLPQSAKELRSFLGTVNLFRDFIPELAHLTASLSELLKGFTKTSVATLKWNDQAKEAFKRTKMSICEGISRNQPDPSKEFVVITDASDKAIGGILAQRDEESRLKTIYAYSKVLDSAQRNYTVTEKELLAIVKSLDRFRHYLLGKEFRLLTDHKALEYLNTCVDPPSRMLRWALRLQDFNFKIEYIQGEDNPADFLSRMNSTENEGKIMTIQEDELTKEKKIEIMNAYHEALGHGSTQNMKFVIGQKYKWPTMYKDIDMMVQKCEICLKAGGERVNTKNKIIRTEFPNEMWEVDMIGYLEKSQRGHKFILVAIDHYSKWIETRALATKDMTTITKAIKELIIDKHGTPKKIYTDNGLEFSNKETQELAQKYNFEWIFNSPGHHNSIGAVERVNQTLMDKLKKLSNFGALDWSNRLEQATLGTNMSFNRSIQTSPFMFRLGRLPDLEIDKTLGKVGIRVDKIASKQKRDEQFPEYAEKNIQKGKITAKAGFNKGEKVLVYREVLGNKLANEWNSGFTISEILSPDNFMVSNGKSTIKANKVHIKKDTSL